MSQPFRPSSGNLVKYDSNNMLAALNDTVEEGDELARYSMAPVRVMPQPTTYNSFYVSRHHEAYPQTAPDQFTGQHWVHDLVWEEAVSTGNRGSFTVSPNFSQAHQRPGHSMHFHHSRALSTVNQHRRHYRTLHPGLNSTSDISQSLSPDPNPSNSWRARGVDEGSIQSPRMGATASSISIRDSRPMRTLQRRAEIAQRPRVGRRLLVLQAREGALGRSRTHHLGSDRRELRSLLPGKGLDDQDHSRPEPKDSDELVVSLECKVCMSQLVDTVMFPCRHAILCRWCAGQLDQICPLCRGKVTKKVQIYLS